MKRTTPILFIVLLTAVLATAGCGSSESLTGDPAEVIGTWDYIVTDGIDALRLNQGVIDITYEDGLLSGTLTAPQIVTTPLQSVRYAAGELTFRVLSIPGQTGAVTFSLDPEGDVMTGTAFPSTGSGTVEAESRRSGSRLSTEVKLTRTQ